MLIIKHYPTYPKVLVSALPLCAKQGSLVPSLSCKEQKREPVTLCSGIQNIHGNVHTTLLHTYTKLHLTLHCRVMLPMKYICVVLTSELTKWHHFGNIRIVSFKVVRELQRKRSHLSCRCNGGIGKIFQQ